MSIARLPNCGWRLRLGVLTLLLILTLLYWKYNSYGLIQPLYKSNPVGFAATQPYVLVSSNYSSLGQLAAGVGTLLPSQVESDPWCQKWAVVAPVDSEWVSEAVFRQARMYGWCLVVIFEKEPSKTYDPRWLPGQGNDIVYLTPANQKRLRNSECSPMEQHWTKDHWLYLCHHTWCYYHLGLWWWQHAQVLDTRSSPTRCTFTGRLPSNFRPHGGFRPLPSPGSTESTLMAKRFATGRCPKRRVQWGPT